MISSLSVGTGSSVSVANNFVIVYIKEYDDYYRVVVDSNEIGSSRNINVPVGARYYLI